MMGPSPVIAGERKPGGLRTSRLASRPWPSRRTAARPRFERLESRSLMAAPSGRAPASRRTPWRTRPWTRPSTWGMSAPARRPRSRARSATAPRAPRTWSGTASRSTARPGHLGAHASAAGFVVQRGPQPVQQRPLRFRRPVRPGRPSPAGSGRRQGRWRRRHARSTSWARGLTTWPSAATATSISIRSWPAAASRGAPATSTCSSASPTPGSRRPPARRC